MPLLRSVITAFACFSTVPMPYLEWHDSNMRYMMAAFPLVGVLIGACVALWAHLCGALGLGTLLWGAGLTVIPVALTGGIHMDGLADVVDAQSSHALPERKREILKDPHTGAFAIIGVGCYLVCYLGLASELAPRQVLQLACVPVISRCLCGHAAVSWRPSGSTGMLASVQANADAPITRRVLAVMLTLAVAALLAAGWLDGADLAQAGAAAQGGGGLLARLGCLLPGIAATLAALAAYLGVRRLAYRDYGGLSGDFLGFFLQLTELAMLACLVFVERLV